MRRTLSIRVAALVLLLSAPLPAQQPAPKPVESGLEEKAQVSLLQVDVVVMDKSGRTVPDLQKTDFSLTMAGKPLVISDLDVFCPIGAADDAVPLKGKQPEPPPPIAPGIKRRVVFAFDYSFMDVTLRPQVLDAAESMLRMSKTPEEEVMIVALTSEVRVEQKFTNDIRRLVGTFSRMKRDTTLWARDYPIGATGRGYFDNIVKLMDVLGSYDGAKAVVFFSQVDYVGSSMHDLFYDDVAAHAASVRAAIYPSKADQLESSGSNDTLVRLANQSGGRMQAWSTDLSTPYRQAQRDLSCRYTVVAHVDPKETRDPQKASVKVNRPDLTIRAPEMVRIFSEEDRQRARAGAAYVDPGPFERPLVRAYAFPALPASSTKWDTVLAVSFPAPVGSAGVDINVRAAVRRDNHTAGEYKRKIHVDPVPGGGTTRPVTLVGTPNLAPGAYELVVVLEDAAGKQIVAAQTPFVVPQILEDLLVLRGPILGRVVPGGELLRANPKDKPENTHLGKALGPSNGFEPLFVQEIETKDKLLYYWSACVWGSVPLGPDVVIRRTFLTATGTVAKALDPIPLKLEDRGKGISCLDRLETLEAGTLSAGDYRLEVTITHPNGDLLGRGTQPLTVR